MKTKDYNSVNWNELFVEDSSSPTGLRWKIKPSKQIKVGSVAGGVQIDKTYGWQCFRVQYNKTSYLVHRILWVMRNGSIVDGLDIDHINGDSLNNSVENLRLVPISINLRNQKRRSNNSTGITGVHFMTNSGVIYAVAQWYDIRGNRKYKLFSCNKLGTELALQKACTYREAMIKELNDQGAGYSDRHGIE